jgi:hypothetical protein
MATISIQADVKAVTSRLSDLARKQIPFATAQAVNALAFEVQRMERAHLGSFFKHPRPFTANSVLVNKGSTSSPTAEVYIRPEVSRYLKPYEFGGVHVIGKVLRDPKNVALDQYGQLTKNKIAQLLARPDVFKGTVHGVAGIWQRVPVTKTTRNKAKRAGAPVQHHLKLLVRWGDALPVHQHLQFEDRARDLIASRVQNVVLQSLTKAIGTAK